MASQIGTTRIYTSGDEATSASKTKCPQCHVSAAPRGTTSTRRTNKAGKGHCPNCGHTYGINSLIPSK